MADEKNLVKWPAERIQEDDNHKLVSTTQITNWDSKLNAVDPVVINSLTLQNTGKDEKSLLIANNTDKGINISYQYNSLQLTSDNIIISATQADDDTYPSKITLNKTGSIEFQANKGDAGYFLFSNPTMGMDFAIYPTSTKSKGYHAAFILNSEMYLGFSKTAYSNSPLITATKPVSLPSILIGQGYLYPSGSSFYELIHNTEGALNINYTNETYISIRPKNLSSSAKDSCYLKTNNLSLKMLNAYQQEWIYIDSTNDIGSAYARFRLINNYSYFLMTFTMYSYNDKSSKEMIIKFFIPSNDDYCYFENHFGASAMVYNYNPMIQIQNMSIFKSPVYFGSEVYLEQGLSSPLNINLNGTKIVYKGDRNNEYDLLINPSTVGAIPSDPKNVTDWDTITTPGFYYSDSSSTTVNNAPCTYCCGNVSKSPRSIVQTVYDEEQDGLVSYTRIGKIQSNKSVVWGDWKSVGFVIPSSK